MNTPNNSPTSEGGALGEALREAAVKAAILPEIDKAEMVMASPQQLADIKASRIARVAVGALDALASTTSAPDAVIGGGDGGPGLGVSLDAIRRLFHDLADRWDVDAEAKELFRSAAYALGDHRDEAEAILVGAPGRWIAWEETEADSDPSDIDCGYSTSWMVGWSHLGARDEEHIIRADTEAEACLLAANLNRLLTYRPALAQPQPVTEPSSGGERDKTILFGIHQALGALRLDAMCDEHGHPYGTTTEALLALDAAEAALSAPIQPPRDGGAREALEDAPEDEAVILFTEGEWVGEASMLRNEDTEEPVWIWANGSPVHPKHKPLAWQRMPTLAALSAPESVGPGEPHAGWIYHNPDSGWEWSPNHPVESGEVEDATEIQAGTAKVLKDLLLAAWDDAEEARAELDGVREFDRTPAPALPATGEETGTLAEAVGREVSAMYVIAAQIEPRDLRAKFLNGLVAIKAASEAPSSPPAETPAPVEGGRPAETVLGGDYGDALEAASRIVGTPPPVPADREGR